MLKLPQFQPELKLSLYLFKKPNNTKSYNNNIKERSIIFRAIRSGPYLGAPSGISGYLRV